MTEPHFAMHIGGMATGKSAGLFAMWDAFEGLAVERICFTGGSSGRISSRTGRWLPAAHVGSWAELVQGIYDVLGCSLVTHKRVLALVDEVQFFHPAEDRRPALALIHDLVRRGSTIAAAGLVTTTEFEPFMPTVEALGFATRVVHHTGARCATCGAPTTHAVCTREKTGAVLEGQDLYEPRCLEHLYDNPNLPQELRHPARVAHPWEPDPTRP